jgi:hypothetical protein
MNAHYIFSNYKTVGVHAFWTLGIEALPHLENDSDGCENGHCLTVQ